MVDGVFVELMLIPLVHVGTSFCTFFFYLYKCAAERNPVYGSCESHGTLVNKLAHNSLDANVGALCGRADHSA